MRTKSLYWSAGMHMTFFVLATVSFPWLRRDFIIPQPIAVELVEISKVTQTNKPAPQPVPEEKKDEKPPEDKPPPAPQNTADEAVTPVKKDQPDDKPEEKKKEVEDENALKKINQKDEKKKKPEPPKKEKPRDFSSVLKNLALEDKKPLPPVPQPDLKLDEKTGASDGQNVPLGEKLTMSEEDALRVQLQKCWNVPFGAKDAENLVVDIFMVINQDRTLQDARVVDMARYNSDTFFRAAADSALRAVRNPLCSPFEVPPDKYETWKTVTVTFDPKNMF